jgi:hypothetical protein
MLNTCKTRMLHIIFFLTYNMDKRCMLNSLQAGMIYVLSILIRIIGHDLRFVSPSVGVSRWLKLTAYVYRTIPYLRSCGNSLSFVLVAFLMKKPPGPIFLQKNHDITQRLEPFNTFSWTSCFITIIILLLILYYVILSDLSQDIQGAFSILTSDLIKTTLRNDNNIYSPYSSKVL